MAWREHKQWANEGLLTNKDMNLSMIRNTLRKHVTDEELKEITRIVNKAAAHTEYTPYHYYQLVLTSLRDDFPTWREMESFKDFIE